MAEESISYIWGQQLTADKPVVIKPNELPALLILNRAVLVAGTEAVISIDISGSKFAIGKLRKESKDQTTLDLRFWELPEEEEQTFEISVTPKGAKVDLTGYYLQEDEEGGSFDEDDDDEDEIGAPYGPMTVEDVTDEEAEKALKLDEKKAKNKQKDSPKQAKSGKQQQQAVAVAAPAPQQDKKGAKKGKQQKEKQATVVAAAAAAVPTEIKPEGTAPVAEKTEVSESSSTPVTPTTAAAGGKKKNKRKADDGTPKTANKKQKGGSTPSPTTPPASGPSSSATTPTVPSKCADCSKDFKNAQALSAHTKAKHNK